MARRDFSPGLPLHWTTSKGAQVAEVDYSWSLTLPPGAMACLWLPENFQGPLKAKATVVPLGGGFLQSVICGLADSRGESVKEFLLSKQHSSLSPCVEKNCEGPTCFFVKAGSGGEKFLLQGFGVELATKATTTDTH